MLKVWTSFRRPLSSILTFPILLAGYVAFSKSGCMCAKSLQSCLTFCNPMNCSLPNSSVCGDSPGKNTAVGCHALLQDLPDPGIEPVSLRSPALAGRFFITTTTWEAKKSIYYLFILSFICPAKS